ncbi:MAG: hypothetical protein ABIF82_06430, partial [Planctomycetota bacterium]
HDRPIPLFDRHGIGTEFGRDRHRQRPGLRFVWPLRLSAPAHEQDIRRDRLRAAFVHARTAGFTPDFRKCLTDKDLRDIVFRQEAPP